MKNMILRIFEIYSILSIFFCSCIQYFSQKNYYMKKVNLFAIFLLVLIGTSTGCKKKEIEPITDNPPTEDNFTFNYYAPNSDGIILQANHETNLSKIFYFGEFHDEENVTINSVTYLCPTGDSLYNFIFDEDYRLKRLYVTFPNGTYDTSLLTFEYPHADTTIVSGYYYNWNTHQDRLKFQSKVYNSEDGLVSEVIYQKSWRPGLQAIGNTLYDVAGVVVAVGVGYLGAAIGAPILGVIGTLVIATAAANASDDIDPADTPYQGPQNPSTHEEPTPVSTPENPNSSFDCANVWNGTAFIDDCGICAGGSTGTVPNSSCGFELSLFSSPDSVIFTGYNTGVISASVSGGTNPFLYSLNDTLNYQSNSTFSNLTSGFYTVYAKDAQNVVKNSSVNVDLVE